MPRQWLAEGKYIPVKGAPTRWGSISYIITPMPERIHVEIVLPDAGFDTVIHLRLRALPGQKICTVELNGKTWTDFCSDDEVVILPRGLKNRNIVDVRYEDLRLK